MLGSLASAFDSMIAFPTLVGFVPLVFAGARACNHSNCEQQAAAEVKGQPPSTTCQGASHSLIATCGRTAYKCTSTTVVVPTRKRYRRAISVRCTSIIRLPYEYGRCYRYSCTVESCLPR